MKYSIAVDIDDVLAQFYPAMCKRFGTHIKQTNIWDPTKEASLVASNFHIIQNNKRFWLSLEKESQPEDIDFPVTCYITSSPSLMRGFRKEWLEFWNFPQAPVISAQNKAQVMRQKDIDVLIDDKPATIRAVQASGLIGIQYVPSYMNEIVEGGNFIRHLSQVREVLKNPK